MKPFLSPVYHLITALPVLVYLKDVANNDQVLEMVMCFRVCV